MEHYIKISQYKIYVELISNIIIIFITTRKYDLYTLQFSKSQLNPLKKKFPNRTIPINNTIVSIKQRSNIL